MRTQFATLLIIAAGVEAVTLIEDLIAPPPRREERSIDSDSTQALEEELTSALTEQLLDSQSHPSSEEETIVSTLVDTIVNELDTVEAEEAQVTEAAAESTGACGTCNSCCATSCCGQDAGDQYDAAAAAYEQHQIQEYLDWYSQFYTEGEIADLTGHLFAHGLPSTFTATSTVDPTLLGLDIHELGQDVIQPAVETALSQLLDMMPGIADLLPDQPTGEDEAIHDVLQRLGVDDDGVIRLTSTHNSVVDNGNGEVNTVGGLEGLKVLSDYYPVCLLLYQPGRDDSETAMQLFEDVQTQNDFFVSFYRVNLGVPALAELFGAEVQTPDFLVYYKYDFEAQEPKEDGMFDSTVDATQLREILTQASLLWYEDNETFEAEAEETSEYQVEVDALVERISEQVTELMNEANQEARSSD